MSGIRTSVIRQLPNSPGIQELFRRLKYGSGVSGSLQRALEELEKSKIVIYHRDVPFQNRFCINHGFDSRAKYGARL